MKQEPVGLYVFKIFIYICVLAVFCMIYWSSLLTEGRLIVIQDDLAQIQKDVQEIKNKRPAREAAPALHGESESLAQKSQHDQSYPFMDNSLPNLLQDDPYYLKTLPKLLGKDFVPSGTLQSYNIGKPRNLHPFSGWIPEAEWQGDVVSGAAQSKFGIYETLAPSLAVKMEQRKGEEGYEEFWVFLRKDIFWEPLKKEFFSEDINLAPEMLKRHPVTAHDFKFFYDAMMNPNVQESGAVAARTFYSDLKDVEVKDDHTFVAKWKTSAVKEGDKVVQRSKYIAKGLTGSLSPLASFVYKYFPDGKKIVEDDSDPNTYRKNSVWAQNFSRHWAKNVMVCCGPWVFDGMTDRQVKFVRNANYYEPLANLIAGREINLKDSPESVWQDFKTDRYEMYIVLPDQLSEVDKFMESEEYKEQESRGSAIHKLTYLQHRYGYIGWNMAHPIFRSAKVRQAMTMAIDRKRIIKQNLNGLAVELTGPFFVGSDAYDKSIKPWPFDLQAAKALLEEEGWFDLDGDGIIDKEIDGKRVPFSFSLNYYVKSPLSKAIADYVSTTLKEIGVQCILNGLDSIDLAAATDQKNFDAIMLSWTTGTPPEDPKQLWSSAGAKEKGSSNFVGFVNEEADEIINQLEYESNREKRIELYHRFHAIIHEEQPYTFLYTPKAILLYRSRLKGVFIPVERQDLIPGANVPEPIPSGYWIEKNV